jgi:hypothetical protein
VPKEEPKPVTKEETKVVVKEEPKAPDATKVELKPVTTVAAAPAPAKSTGDDVYQQFVPQKTTGSKVMAARAAIAGAIDPSKAPSPQATTGGVAKRWAPPQQQQQQPTAAASAAPRANLATLRAGFENPKPAEPPKPQEPARAAEFSRVKARAAAAGGETGMSMPAMGGGIGGYHTVTMPFSVEAADALG